MQQRSNDDWPREAIEAALRTGAAAARWPGGIAFEALREIDSTNSEALRRVRSGRDEPLLLVAGLQTAGRGRLGRAWAGSAGASLAFSLSLPLAPRDWSGLSLAVGVALADSLDPGCAHGISLKWPNDLWWRHRKLAGILIETIACASRQRQHDSAIHERHAVIGVGINIGAQAGNDAFSTPPAWLREIDAGAAAQSVLLRVAAPLVEALAIFEAQRFAPFHARFYARDVLRGRLVTVAGVGADAQPALEGIAQGVSDGGALLVRSGDDGTLQQLTSHEVSVRPAASVAGESR